MTKTKLNPLTNLEGFYEELQNESPRGAVIIASAFLDAQLRALISSFLISDEKVVDQLLGTEDGSDSPLSSFSSRIKTAYCLGLISQHMYDDLNFIRKIRNKFAHKMHGYTFDEPEIIRWCKSLRLAKEITDAVPHLPNAHGDMFLLGVVRLSTGLALKTVEAERDRRTVPEDIEMGGVVTVGKTTNS